MTIVCSQQLNGSPLKDSINVKDLAEEVNDWNENQLLNTSVEDSLQSTLSTNTELTSLSSIGMGLSPINMKHELMSVKTDLAPFVIEVNHLTFLGPQSKSPYHSRGIPKHSRSRPTTFSLDSILPSASTSEMILLPSSLPVWISKLTKYATRSIPP